MVSILFSLIVIGLASYYLFSNDKEVIYLKYYMFDWDDNIFITNSRIYLYNINHKEVPITTKEYSKIKHLFNDKSCLVIEPFEYNNETIIGLSNFDKGFAFRDFSYNLISFLHDVQNSKLGPSWNDFIEAINNGCYFGIITARRNEPSIFKDTVKILINNNYKGISKDKLIDSLKLLKELIKEEYTTDEEEIDEYLHNCLFYPVAYYNNSGTNKPETFKVEQIINFRNKLKKNIKKINRNLIDKGIYEYKFAGKFGFSDDDLTTIEYSKRVSGVNIYSTDDGVKNLIKK
jgi:hypothetical protein